MKAGLAAALFLCGGSPAWGNGGGYWNRGVKELGEVTGFVPEQTQWVEMAEENLVARLGPETARVEIEYLLINHAPDTVRVRFAFPVEEGIEDPGYRPKDAETAVAQPSYCKNYRVEADGEALAAQWQAEEQPLQENDPRQGLAGWFVSELEFAPGNQKRLRIRFESEYIHDSVSVSESRSVTARNFTYRVSTAACWHGTIGQGRIELRPDGVDPAGVVPLNPPGQFERDGDAWVWNFENLEPTLANDFAVQAVAETFQGEGIRGPEWARGDEQGEDLIDLDETSRGVIEGDTGQPRRGVVGGYFRRGEEFSILNRDYEITASSTLAAGEDGQDYAAENLRSPWDDKVWSEGNPGAGVGEWLELVPRVAKPLRAVLIRPGFQGDTKANRDEVDLFQANARPRRVRITLNETHQFETELADRAEELTIPIRDFAEPVERVRLEFLSVWPGTQFEDLCVSSIALETRVEGRPYLLHSR